MKAVLATLVIICVSIIAASQTATPALTKAQWREDVSYFGSELQKRHKNAFHTVSKTEFDKMVDDLIAAVPTLEPHQIVVRMAQITAKVGDGHTRVHVPTWFRSYPFGLFWFGDELRVTRVLPPQKEIVGTKLIKVNGLDISEVRKRVRSLVPQAENDWLEMNNSAGYMTRPEYLQALGIVEDVNKAKFTFQQDDGTQFTREIESFLPDGSGSRTFISAAASQPISNQNLNETLWFTYLADQNAIYANWRNYENLSDHAAELFKLVDKYPGAQLIVDMRQNGGGDFYKGRGNIIDPIKRRAVNQKGKLYVLIGRRTFSAAMVNAIDFRKDTNAILVGEPIGERPNSYSENDEMTLPNSKIIASYSTKYYKFLDEDVPAVMPDKRIDPDWASFKAGRDPVLDWIFSAKP